MRDHVAVRTVAANKATMAPVSRIVLLRKCIVLPKMTATNLLPLDVQQLIGCLDFKLQRRQRHGAKTQKECGKVAEGVALEPKGQQGSTPSKPYYA